MSWKTFKSLVVGVGIILLTSLLMTACGDNTYIDHVPLRDGKSDSPIEGEVVSDLKKETQVTYQEEKKDGGLDWVKIKIDFKDGFWIEKKYLSCTKEQKEANCKVVVPEPSTK